MDLRSLRHALALGRHRHYGRAAAALYLSQPALSRSIAALERGLGVRLFERGRQGVRPTAFGELLLARGESLLDDVAELEREIARRQGLASGELRVGAGLYPAEISVATALGRLATRHPGLRLSLVGTDWRGVVEALRVRRLDLAVVELAPFAGDATIATQPLAPHPGVIVCRPGHPLLARRRRDLAGILAYPLVGPRLPPRVGTALLGSARGLVTDALGDLVPAYHVETVQPAKLMVAASDAIAILPRPLVRSELAAGSLVALDYRAPWLRTNYGFAWPRERPLSPPAEAFMAAVRAVEAGIDAAAPP
jgi:DNA-binding transcriptional LysR family regulator